MSKYRGIENPFMKKIEKTHNAEKIERGPFGIFQHPSCHKTPKKLNGGLFGDNFLSDKKKSHNAEKLKSGTL